MKNNGLFCSLFIEDLKKNIAPSDAALGRMSTLAHAWRNCDVKDENLLWESYIRRALSYLEFVPANQPEAPGAYPLYEDYGFTDCVSVLYLVPPGRDINDTSIGSYYPAKLLAHLEKRKINWGILTDGLCWRLYSTKSSRPYEDYIELALAETLESSDEAEYSLFEHFFHKDSFILEDEKDATKDSSDEVAALAKCRLDHDRKHSEEALDQYVKEPFLEQIDEVLQNICNGFIYETRKNKMSGSGGLEYTEEGRREIFESAVKLIYRCLFLFYAEARRLFPAKPEQVRRYQRLSMCTLCQEAYKFRWGQRRDNEGYDLWKHLKGLIDAVNNGDPEYGIMGYDGGLFDDEEEIFLGQHQLRNNFLAKALYLLAFVDPLDGDPASEYPIPYEDLEVRHLGELYENILEYTVSLADAEYIRRRNKKGVETLLLSSQTAEKAGDTLIEKGDVFFGESALERKQTGSYYTPESLVRFLNLKSIVQPLKNIFEQKYRLRFDSLLEQARNGHSAEIKRGAVTSAADLVKRFVEGDLLSFKVCDPAMGSGHFLVDAANQMAGLVVSLLAEIPYIEGVVAKPGHPNYWRRLITRHCIYGVDLNPLAVNLAKLSLWLNSFAVEHKLTFLDHHLRCGNSLIGIRSVEQLATVPRRRSEKRINNDKQLVLFDLDNLSAVLNQAAGDIFSISQIDEDDTDAQKAVLEKSEDGVAAIKPLADLYTAYLIDQKINAGDYEKIFKSLAEDNPVKVVPEALQKILESVEGYSIRHSFFHWPLEFLDIFGPGGPGGFTATVGNPPWDVLQPNTQEFYIQYDSNFRRYKKQEALKILKRLHAEHPHIAEKWYKYENSLREASNYYKEPIAYTCLQKGKIDLYKAFLERFFVVLTNGGSMGIVVPSGIYTDQSSQPLRELFFTNSQVEFLYCFENRYCIFNIHRSFKFVLFGTKKCGETDSFKCAFMEHDPERLYEIDKSALRISLKQVRRFSPYTLNLIEFTSQRDVNIMSVIYGNLPDLGKYVRDSWNLELSQEFNRSSDSHLFNSDGIGCTLFEGKNTHSFDHQFTIANYWIDEGAVIENEHRTRWKILRKIGKRPLQFDYEQYRAVFRRIAASTNERSFIATVIPQKSVCPDTNLVVRRLRPSPQSGEPIENIALDETLYLIGILNSFACDYVIRQKITTHLDMHFVYTVPMLRLNKRNSFKGVFYSLVARAARLVSVDALFRVLWKEQFVDQWQIPEFWYPTCAPIDNYGPAHEQQIRKRLRDEAKNLTPEWGPHCGVHDRLPDRRDKGDRAQLRAEIDAYVAHLYGLSRDDFAYILDTFPVLRKKEEKAFGEFMSKRKCLEEYDRIKLILGEIE